MYPPLKKAIWSLIDTAIAHRFGARPLNRAMTRRAFLLRRTEVSAYLVVEFDDFAGGRFSFLGALARGAKPDARTTYAATLQCPAPGEVRLAEFEGLGETGCAVHIASDWLTPPAARVRDAFALPTAHPYLEALGVSEESGHHLLSFGILEAFGVQIRERDYLPVVELVQPLITAAVEGPVVRATNALLARAADCSVGGCGGPP